MKMQKKGLHMATFILLVIGGLNWLAFGIFQQEVGSLVGGPDQAVARTIYILVGLAAIYEIATHKKNCRTCNDKSSNAPSMPTTPQA